MYARLYADCSRLHRRVHPGRKQGTWISKNAVKKLLPVKEGLFSIMEQEAKPSYLERMQELCSESENPKLEAFATSSSYENKHYLPMPGIKKK